MGNGNGISALKISQGNAPAWPWQAEALHGDFEKAIELQIGNSPIIPVGEKLPLAKSLREASATFELEPIKFMSDVVEASYQDVMADPDLMRVLRRRYAGQDVSLTKFPEVGPDQVRGISTAEPESDGPGIVLSAALLNLQLAMSSSLPNCDFTTIENGPNILNRKLRRASWADRRPNAAVTRIAVPGIPDIADAIKDSRVSSIDVWKLRHSKSAQAFRKWLAEEGPTDRKGFQAAFLDMLREEPWIGRTTAKTLRWALLTIAGGALGHVVGVAGEIAGAAAGGLDLFSERLLGGYHPRLFIDEIGSLRIAPKTRLFRP